MHDFANLERDGIATVFVASSAFVDAARVQAEALGVDATAVFVDHPVQDRTDEEVRALADEAIDRIVDAITASAG